MAKITYGEIGKIIHKFKNEQTIIPGIELKCRELKKYASDMTIYTGLVWIENKCQALKKDINETIDLINEVLRHQVDDDNNNVNQKT